MSSNEAGKRSSFPPFEPNPPPREKRGYTLFPTGGKPPPAEQPSHPSSRPLTPPLELTDVSHSRASSTGHGPSYQEKDTHPYQGKMLADYNAYKTAHLDFKDASTRLAAAKEQWAPPKDAAKPADMATYGQGKSYTPAGHRALIQPTAVASEAAYQAYASRQTHTEEHIGRAYKSYAGTNSFKSHRKQTVELRDSHGNLNRELAQHVEYSTSPERTRSDAESSKKGRK